MAGEQRQGWKQQSSGCINNVRGALLCLQPRPGLTHSYVSFSFVFLSPLPPCRQPVTKNTFRHYRVLGKGGFGEVSVYDNSNDYNNYDDDNKKKCWRHCWRKFRPSVGASGEMRF